MGGRSCFRLRTVTLAPLETVDYRCADWAGTFVIVQQGKLEIECHSGVRAWFGAGAMLAFADLNPRLLRNIGCDQLVLCALSRIRPDE